MSQLGRNEIGGVEEFQTFHISPLYQDEINSLQRSGNLNVCIIDDYMNYGNGFNAVRCLLKSLGVNKIIFVSLGCYRKTFTKREYIITGDVYQPGYSWRKVGKQILIPLEMDPNVNEEIGKLYLESVGR